MIDLGPELTAWLASAEARALLLDIVREAVRIEVRAMLDEELLDTREAAQILNMSEAALRKAVERGQFPCQHVGRRLRFRRSDLLKATTP
jgi:excisionase family DNA binding protein